MSSALSDIVATGSRRERPDTYDAIHTAQLAGAEALPSGWLRADAPATLEYQLKPRVEVQAGNLTGEPAENLLVAIARGGRIEITFDCYPCREENRRQPAQALVLDNSTLLRDRTLRSLPLRFPFTPLGRGNEQLERISVKPHVALSFKLDGYDLDRWVIPLRLLGPGDAPTISRATQLSRALGQSQRRPYSGQGLPVLRLRYSNTADGRSQQIEVTASRSLLPWLTALGAPSPDPAGLVVGVGDETVSIRLPVRYSSTAMEAAAKDLQNVLDVTMRSVGDDGSSSCRVPAEGIADQTKLSSALRACVVSTATNLRNIVLPGRLRQALYDLARCDVTRSDDDDERESPVLVFEGLPYMPLQLLPVDEPAAQRRCSSGLRPLLPDDDAPTGVTDDFLGLILPLLMVPQNASQVFSRDEESVAEDNDEPPVAPAVRVLGGVYRDVPADGETEPPASGRTEELFEQMAQAISAMDSAGVSRNATSFLTDLVRSRKHLDLIVVNSHGQRRGRNENTGILGTDQIVFSHWSTLMMDASADVPSGARARSSDITGTFAGIPDSDEFMPLTRRPTVVLLACDTAPYRGDSSIPYAFFAAGAGAVIATDVEVPDELAQIFGRALVSELEDEPVSIAVLNARRSLWKSNKTIVPLLWSALGADGTVR